MASEGVTSNPFVSAETLGARALIGLRLLAAGEDAESSSSEQREHNVESLALNVMGQDQSGGKIPLFLEDWELARVALSCHIALNLLCQEMHKPW